jgi:hypothetical protein
MAVLTDKYLPGILLMKINGGDIDDGMKATRKGLSQYLSKN